MEYLTEEEVSKFIKRSVHTLRKDRHEGKGLPYVKFEKQVLYSSVELEKYMAEHTIQPKNI